MSIITEIECYFKKIILSLGYDIDDVVLVKSSRPDLGEYQINSCMSIGKKYNENPREVAQKIIDKLDNRFKNVNIAGPGFINISISETYLIDYINKLFNNFDLFIDEKDNKKIIIDYGGANAAKALHVGHMRSANIGEALKRLARLFNKEVIGDVHLGDLGRQSGMVISEIKKREPKLPYFDENYKGEYPKFKITQEQLSTYYPEASKDAKENPERMEEVRKISLEIDKGKEPLFSLWKDITEESSKDIKKIYDYLNCTFELWEGEMSSFKYMNETLKVLEPYMYESEGAKVIDVKQDDDKLEYPPVIVIKNDGATIYATREFATLYGRIKNYNPDSIWYLMDQRQSQYINGVFRAAYKTNLVEKNTSLEYYGFGTINGKDGKPYKTRDGGVLELKELIKLVKEEISKRMVQFDDEEKKNQISDILTVAAIKYADLLPFRTTDYIFDIEKFCSFEGKTGPYILYTMVRIKSILNKANIENNKITNIYSTTEKEIYLKLIELNKILKNSYKDRTLSYICEYLYEICGLFNKFYGENNIINEQSLEKKKDYVGMLTLLYSVLEKLLNILAIDIPEKM